MKLKTQLRATGAIAWTKGNGLLGQPDSSFSLPLHAADVSDPQGGISGARRQRGRAAVGADQWVDS